MTPKKARQKVVKAGVGSIDTDETYRACKFFIWLEKAPVMPEWWLDQHAKGNIILNGKYVIRCPGALCQQRTTPHYGNKACSNGGLCNECCDEYQRGGFLPNCSYSSHNFKKKLELVSSKLDLTHPKD